MYEFIAAFAIVLLGIVFYSVFLSRRQRRLARELELLENPGKEREIYWFSNEKAA